MCISQFQWDSIHIQSCIGIYFILDSQTLDQNKSHFNLADWRLRKRTSSWYKPDSGSYTKNLSDYKYYITDKDMGIHMVISTFFLRILADFPFNLRRPIERNDRNTPNENPDFNFRFRNRCSRILYIYYIFFFQRKFSLEHHAFGVAFHGLSDSKASTWTAPSWSFSDSEQDDDDNATLDKNLRPPSFRISWGLEDNLLIATTRSSKMLPPPQKWAHGWQSVWSSDKTSANIFKFSTLSLKQK